MGSHHPACGDRASAALPEPRDCRGAIPENIKGWEGSWGPCALPWCWKTAKWLEVGNVGGGGVQVTGRPSQYR